MSYVVSIKIDFFASEKGVILNKSISWSDFSILFILNKVWKNIQYLKFTNQK